MRIKTVNSSYEIKKTRYQKSKEILGLMIEKAFQFIFMIVVILVALSCFVYFSYSGIKYLYTFTENEIAEYHQKKEDLINKKIEIEFRLAFRTYKESGLSGLTELSKSRYEFLEKNKGDLADLYRIVAIDIAGEQLDEVFLDQLTRIAGENTDTDSATIVTKALKNDYFRKTSTNDRIAKIRNFISGKVVDTEVMRFHVQKTFARIASEQLGNDNQLTNVTAKNIIKTTMAFAHDFIDSFGIAGLQGFSQLCYREMEQSVTIGLQQVERCFVIDVYGLTYSVINKLSRTSATEYFAIESVRNRPTAFFNKLGFSEEESFKYRQAWIDEIKIQSKQYNKKDDEL